MWDNLKKSWKSCQRLRESTTRIVIKSRANNRILNKKSFGVFKITNFYNTFKNVSVLQFLNLKGFDVDSLIGIPNINLEFYSDFNLYKQTGLVKGCTDFFDSKSNGFIFRREKLKYIPQFTINKPKISYPICSLFFRYARIENLIIYTFADTFFKKNLLTFESSNLSQGLFLNSSVRNFLASNCFGIKLDSNFLNPSILSDCESYVFDCHFNSIQIDVFRPFRKLGVLMFNPIYLIELIRNHGIEWIKEINSDLNVNLRNESDLKRHILRLVQIHFFYTRDFLFASNRHFANDADFCLFYDFPFQQLIFLVPYSGFHIELEEHLSLYLNKTQFSCTELWLYQFYRRFIFIYNYYYDKLSKSNFKNCDFRQRIKLCSRGSKTKISETKFTSFDLVLVFELVVLILSSSVSFLGIGTNLATIIVILKEVNKKTMREKHYMYICLHCASNMIICFIQLLNLMSECQYPIGFYCSSIRYLVAIQYIRIIFGEYFNSMFRLISNFTYLGFSLCRMSRVGKDHGKLIILMNNLSIKTYMGVCVVFSGGLSICKALQFDINRDLPLLGFPLPFSQNIYRTRWSSSSHYVALTVVNAIYDMINYFLFVFVHLIVDIVLVRKLKRVIEEKQEKMREMSGIENEKILKDNEESKKRALLMVVFCLSFNLVTKFPSMIASLNDVRILILRPYDKHAMLNAELFGFNPFRTVLSFKFFCSNEKSCLLFQNFGNFLFLISLSSILGFLRKFDKNFAIAFENVFGK